MTPYLNAWCPLPGTFRKEYYGVIVSLLKEIDIAKGYLLVR